MEVTWLHRVSLCHSTLILTWTRPAAVKVPDSHDIVFSHDPLGNVPPRKAARHDKKSWKNTKAQRGGGRSGRVGRLGPDRGLGLAIQPGHSNSERMLMRLLWSLRCFPCFQHLQGPHGARSIKTTKWEIWTFFCDAGGLFAFQPGRPFSVPRRKEKIRKKLPQGVWMSKLSRKWHICEPEVIINLWPRKGEAFDAGRIAGWWDWKGGKRKGREMLKFGGCFSQPL